LIAIACIHGFGLDLPKVEILFTVIVFANPPFLYFMSFFFRKEESGSLFIKLMHFLLGLIAPLALFILSFINDKTRDIGDTLRWFLYPFPIFSLINGYISINGRDISMWINELDEKPEIYSKYVAGYPLCFLLGGLGFYWILVALFELKVFDIEKCLSGRGKSN